jgi:hypothetical protein
MLIVALRSQSVFFFGVWLKEPLQFGWWVWPLGGGLLAVLSYAMFLLNRRPNSN